MYGDPNVLKEVHYCGMTVPDRFWKYVKKTKSCWDWLGAKRQGYGAMNVQGKSKPVHRISWEMHYGGIPEGNLVLHKCDNRSCVNPDHLYLGNYQDNVDDMWNRNRAPRGQQRTNQSVLTDTKVRQIRQDTGSVRALAKKYGVSTTTIWAVRNRKIWKHL